MLADKTLLVTINLQRLQIPAWSSILDCFQDNFCYSAAYTHQLERYGNHHTESSRNIPKIVNL